MAARDKAWKTAQRAHKLTPARKVVIIRTDGEGTR